MRRKFRTISRCKPMRLLSIYIKAAGKKYLRTKAGERKIECVLLNGIFENLMKLRFKPNNLRVWLKWSLPYLEAVITSLITEGRRYRLIRRTEELNVEEMYLGIRLATCASFYVYDYLKSESDKFLP